MHICEWRLQWAVVRAHTGQQLVLALAVSLNIFGWRSAGDARTTRTTSLLLL